MIAIGLRAEMLASQNRIMPDNPDREFVVAVETNPDMDGDELDVNRRAGGNSADRTRFGRGCGFPRNLRSFPRIQPVAGRI